MYDRLTLYLQEAWLMIENKNLVYHGTDKEAADDIIKNGIDMSKSQLGYFGRGFYTTPDLALAKSNYADFADDEEDGVVLGLEVSSDARLLDLRNEDDWITYRDSTYRGRKLTDLLGVSNFDEIMVSLGFDGLYDESFGGWVFYNPSVLKVTGAVDMDKI